jgi:hypothetical protein
MPLEPLICRSRYGNVKKSYKNRRKLGKSEKTMHLCSVQKNKSINYKNLKIMAATNWTIIKRNKATNQIVIFNLESKWTYKTAIGIATELNNDEINELVCIVETNKIMLKNDKKEIQTDELPIG